MYLWILLGVGAWLLCFYLLKEKPIKEYDEAAIDSEFTVSDIANYEEIASMHLDVIRKNMKVMHNQDAFDPMLSLMKDWYIKLCEIYRHDKKKKIEVVDDWLRYVSHTSASMVSSHALQQKGWMRTKEEKVEEEESLRKMNLEKEVIEKRFAKLVDGESELACVRLKEEIERHYFMISYEDFSSFISTLVGESRIDDVDALKKLLALVKDMEAKGEHIRFKKDDVALVEDLKRRLAA
jgi:hypothetical protein